jgi:outer membrane receptor protein involved in Fe transport
VRENPQQQVQLRSYVDLPCHLELNGAAYFVDQIQSRARLVEQRVPSYLRFDVGLTWHPTKSVEVGIWGQNLFDDRHPESDSYRTSFQTEVPRGVMGRITLRF